MTRYRATSARNDIALTLEGELGDDGKAYEVEVIIRGFRGTGARTRSQKILSAAQDAKSPAEMLHHLVEAGVSLLKAKS